MMKLIEMKTKINQVLPANLSASDFPFITDYYAHKTEYDTILWLRFGLQDLICEIENASAWNSLITSILYFNKDALKNLWNVNIAEYSPVDNVTEETIVNHHTRAHEDKTTYGETKVSENVGVDGKEGGSVVTTTTREVPTDSTIEREVASETVETEGKPLTTWTEGDTHEDTTNYGVQHERFKTNRHGNIGTMLATTIMQGSVDFWGAYNFYYNLYRLIMDEICGGLW